MTKRALVVTFVCVAICLWLAHAVHEVRASEAFFDSTLRAAHAPDYRPGLSYKELRTAYALTLTRHTPIFGIAGTDPAALTVHTNELKETLEKLKQAQKNDEDAIMIENLYPTTFLAALAVLEERRQAFLTSGSDADYERYDGQLVQAIDAYENDIARFKENFERAVPENAMRIPTFGGTITTASLLGSVAQLEDRAKSIREEYLRRARCLDGKISSCDTRQLMPPTLTIADSEAHPSAIPNIGRDIISLRADAYGKKYRAEDIQPVLFSSSCLAEEAGPHYTIAISTDGFAVRYIGDLFLSVLSKSNGPTARYLYGLGIGYLQHNPFNYYTCPDLMHDLGRARAMTDIRAFAAHNLIAAEEREALLSEEVVTEAAVAEYLSAAFNESTDTNTRAELTELALSFAARSAGLEFILADIVRVTNNDVHFAVSGIPFDISAQKLYLSHSAFPSLFLTHTDAHSKLYEPHTARDAEAFSQYALRYSNLRSSLPRENILADYRAFLQFEGILP